MLYITRPFLTAAAAAVNCFVAVCAGTDKQTDRKSEEANSPPSSPAVATDALGGEQ